MYSTSEDTLSVLDEPILAKHLNEKLKQKKEATFGEPQHFNFDYVIDEHFRKENFYNLVLKNQSASK